VAARAVAFDRSDAREVAAWTAVFSFMQDTQGLDARENVKRLTLVLGQMTANSLSKMKLTIYRLDDAPFFLLPDLPVLGMARPGGDVPESGSFVMFPFDHRHLLVFDADADADELRNNSDERLDQLLRTHFPHAPRSLRNAHDWSTTIAWTSMVAESYALQGADIKAVAARMAPGVRILVKTTPSARGPGIDLS
jgi:hypothetical protein